MIKEDYPENSILHMNQGHLTIKDNKTFLLSDYYILPQVNESIKSTRGYHNYVMFVKKEKLRCIAHDTIL